MLDDHEYEDEPCSCISVNLTNNLSSVDYQYRNSNQHYVKQLWNNGSLGLIFVAK